MKTHLRRLIFVLLAIEGLTAVAACGAQKANDATTEKAKACEVIKDLYRACYDESSPDIACAQLSGSLRDAFAKKTSDRKLIDDATRLCSAACDARKDGRSWSDINSRLDCSQIARK